MAPPLKNRIGRPTVQLLAGRLAHASSAFDEHAFVREVLDQLDALELKDRVNLLTDRMACELPDEYQEALKVVVSVASEGLDEWAAWPLCSFVERHGLDHPTESLDAMAILTTQWSCEFAIRPFLNTHLELTREYLREWITDTDEAVRRLASEGTRPLLPWRPRVASLTDDPQIGIEVLEALRHDGSEIVRRSVANHLNDMSKSRPDLVVEVLTGWTGEPIPVDRRLVRHALRTLIKRGHHGALALLGFTTEPHVEVAVFECSPNTIKLGSEIELMYMAMRKSPVWPDEVPAGGHGKSPLVATRSPHLSLKYPSWVSLGR